MSKKKNTKIDVHARNVRGIGAVKYGSALLNDLEDTLGVSVGYAFFHSNFQFGEKLNIEREYISAYAFGQLSRLFELIFWRYKTRSSNDILVLGDLPLNTRSKQFVLFHQSLLFEKCELFKPSTWKFVLYKILFVLNLKNDDVILVQSETMKEKISSLVKSNVSVEVLETPQTLFSWLDFRRTSRNVCSFPDDKKINLIYPAAPYPHKNHSLVDEVQVSDDFNILFTCVGDEVTVESSRVTYLGALTQDEIYNHYAICDGLLFLSKSESLGIPLLEAVKCNLPIVCPYSEYTKWLEGKNCFFFDLDDPESFLASLQALEEKLKNGWWPNWDFDKAVASGSSNNLENILNIRKGE